MASINRSKLIILLLVAIVIFQNPPWFIWSISYPLLAGSVVLIFLLCGKRLSRNSGVLFYVMPILLSVTAFFAVYSSLYEFRVSSLITILVYVSLLIINDEEKIEALSLLTRLLSVITFVSLLAWAFNFYSPILPFEYIYYGEGKGDLQNTVIKNYYLFLQLESDWNVRFYSVFDEPGIIGTLFSFVLFGNKYDFKNKNNVILLIGGICSLSLAFIFISALGYLIQAKKKNLKSIILLGIFIFILVIVFSSNDAFSKLVLDRISNINDSGVESRTSLALSVFFDDFKYSADFLLGMGTNFFSINPSLREGQSYKIFFIEYGVLGFVLISLMYLSLSRKNIKLGFACLVLFAFSFLQRPGMFTPWQLILFSMIFSNINIRNKKIKIQ